jgi:signal transduction histidine kinase
MLRVLGCITEQHDLRLVVLAGLLCMFACWTAMSLLARAHVGAKLSRNLWIAAAAAVFGSGIWATHFVAMIAYTPGFPVSYGIALTTLSIVIAAGLSAVGFALSFRAGFAAAGLGFAGAAIGAMHYTGMAALEGPFDLVWDIRYVAASVVVGIACAAAAGYAFDAFKNIYGRAAAALLLTIGICSMHFTGMTAVTLMPDAAMAASGAILDPPALGIAVAAVAAFIIGLGLVGALLDSHLANRAAQEAERLRAHIAELETTKAELEETSLHLRAALESAALANQAKSQFLATMSHELRTPLNAVIGFSEIMAAETFGPLGHKRYMGYAEDIRASGAHLLSLINDILDLSRLDGGQTELDEEELDLTTVIGETARMVEGQAEAAHLQLMKKVEPGLPTIRADRRRIRQVLINLLSNAIKFTPAKGHITVSAFRHGAEIVISVADTGIGIAKDDLSRAVEHFSQIDSALSRKYEGAGLGLPISKKLVEAHGGRLELESERDVGTTVSVFLPVDRTVEPALRVA